MTNMSVRGVVVGIVVIGVSLSACGDDPNDWPDTAPTSRFDPDTKENVEVPDDEIGVIQSGLDALNDMPHDLAQQTFDMVTHAVFFEEWTEVCDTLDQAAAIVEENGVLAVNSDAWNAIDALLGESVRYGAKDDVIAECAPEITRANNAQTDAFDS